MTDPSTDKVSGHVQAGINTARNAPDPGYSMRGAVNLPVSDTLAVRLSSFSRRDAGNIDNPVRDERGVNQTNASGGRFSALWRPSESFSWKFGAMLQNSKSDGSPAVFLAPGFGDLEQNYLPGAGANETEAHILNSTIKAKLSSVDFISVTGYSFNRWIGTLDNTSLASITQPIFGVDGLRFDERFNIYKFSQEVRLSGAINERIDWLLGGFYTQEKTTLFDDLPAIDSQSGTIPGSWGTLGAGSIYKEYAAFAALTYKFTDRFDVQVGGRQSRLIAQYKGMTVTGGFASTFFGSDPYSEPSQPENSESTFTYLLTPRFKISPDMIYMEIGRASCRERV